MLGFLVDHCLPSFCITRSAYRIITIVYVVEQTRDGEIRETSSIRSESVLYASQMHAGGGSV